MKAINFDASINITDLNNQMLLIGVTLSADLQDHTSLMGRALYDFMEAAVWEYLKKFNYRTASIKSLNLIKKQNGRTGQ